MRPRGLSSAVGAHAIPTRSRLPCSHFVQLKLLLLPTLAYFQQSALLTHSLFLSLSCVPLYFSIQMSVLSSPLPHNHLTPLRSCAEASFTPLSSLQLQVLLALTRWPLSNQHLLGFIPLPSLPPFIIFPSLPSVRLIRLFPVLEEVIVPRCVRLEIIVSFLLCDIYFVRKSTNQMRI